LLFACALSAQRMTIGGHLVNIGGSSISNIAPKVTIDSAVVQDATPGRFSVFFSEYIDGVSPDVSEWTITINGTPHTADSYQIWYDQVNFYSGSVEAQYGDIVTITYSGNSWISYPLYNQVRNYGNYSITNYVEEVTPDPDAYVAGIGASHTYTPYNSLDDSTGYDVMNLAFPGAFIDEQQDNWDTVTNTEAFDYVIVAVGTNNCVTGTPDSATIVNEYIDLLASINNDISSTCKVICFTLVASTDAEVVSESDMAVMRSFNSWLETVPTGVDLVSTDNTDDLMLGDVINPLYVSDDPEDPLHFNDAGKAVVVQNLIDAIDSASVIENYTILYQWDFETASLGDFGETEIDDYFPYNFIKYSVGGGDSIVIDEIDGTPTQVLKIREEMGGGQSGGLTIRTYFDVSHTEYDSLCISYRHKFEPDYECMSGNSKIGAKLRGHDGINYVDSPTDESYPTDFYAGQLLVAGMQMTDYLYAWYTPDFFDYNPFSLIGEGEANGEVPYPHGDSTFYIPGVWYSETVCAAMNSVGDATNSRYEQWTNGDMIVSMPTAVSGDDEFGFLEHPDQLKINYTLIGGFQSKPDQGHNGSKDSYYYIDDVTIWTPKNDAYWDSGQLHPSGTKITSPTAIDDLTVYWDTLINLTGTPDTIYSTDYSSDVGAGWTGAWLVDAGDGNTVTATALSTSSIGEDDWMQVYDSNDANGDLLYWILGNDFNLLDSFDGGGATIESSGRYLYICAGSCEKEIGTTAFRFKVDITP